MDEWLIAAGLVIGMLSAFRWLFKAVTHEIIGWWDSVTFVFLGGLLRRGLQFVTSFFDQIPDWVPTWGGFALYLLLMYWLLRGWKQCTPTQSAIIIAVWIPLVILSVVIFLMTNPGIAD